MRNSDISSENTRFKSLQHNPEFLDGLLSNISSCVLILNKELKLTCFNDAIKTIFSNKPDEDLLYRRCGEAIGCAASVDEMKDCGTTSKCCHCALRKAGLMTYATGKAVYKKRISKEFYRHSGNKELKHLQFSTRLVPVEDEKYVMVVVEDVTPLLNQRMEIEHLKGQLATAS